MVTERDDDAFVARLPEQWREPVADFLRRLRATSPRDPMFLHGGALKHFALDANGEAFEAPLAHWCAWFEVGQRLGRNRGYDHPRRLAYDRRGRVEVSTVFSPMPRFDFPLNDQRPEWETMIFGGPLSNEQWRYRSRAEARVGHVAALAVVRFARQAPRRLKIAAERLADGKRVSRHWHRRVQAYRRRVEVYAEFAFAEGMVH